MNYSIFDIETTNLETIDPEKIHIHCLSVKQYKDGEARLFTLTDSNEMKEFLSNEEIFIGHNIKRFDIPILQNKLGIDLSKKRLIDTLGGSWYLYPDREDHNLYNWGEDLGIEKPIVEDWTADNIDGIILRCEADVKITDALWNLQADYLLRIYENPEAALRLCGYITFKLDCAREQEEVRWKLDTNKCRENLVILAAEKEKKIQILSEIMPRVVEYRIAKRPKVTYKKDKTLSEHGKKWLEILKSLELPDYHIGNVKVPTGKTEIGNPGSHQQLKAWLYSLGWIPQTYNYIKEDDGGFRKVPQINTKDDGICESVKLLYEANPELEHIEGLFTLVHRIGILNAFLGEVSEDGYLKAEIQGLTNTLRFQHVKPLVNLPTVPKLYWEYIREVLIAPSYEYVLCGSDMSQLEDQTARHYMWDYDPEYVKLLANKDYDPHLHIATEAKLLTIEQAEEHKLYVRTEGKEGVSHKATRLKGKKTNFAAKYGAGIPKIAITAGILTEVSRSLYKAYWKINWSIKAIARNCKIKTVGTAKWLYNPVSEFWYSLRDAKDAFSTLNQSTGAYCFDTWLRKVRAKGIKICYQSHDEHVEPVLKIDKEAHSEKLLEAIKETNEELRLNVILGISIDYGDSYKDIH